MTDHSAIQERARRLVQQEVRLCLSSIVSTLAGSYGGLDSHSDSGGEIVALAEQAFELAAPIPDYEEAARDAGFSPDADGQWSCSAKDATYGSPEDACHDWNIDPYDREVFEHWAISDWLADKLEAKGEKVERDFANLTVWARTTTGQAIYCDGVIKDIARELMAGAEG